MRWGGWEEWDSESEFEKGPHASGGFFLYPLSKLDSIEFPVDMHQSFDRLLMLTTSSMDNPGSISVATLKNRLTALETDIERLTDEKRHIEYVLKNYASVKEAGFPKVVIANNNKKTSIPVKAMGQVITDFLRIKGHAMKSSHIRAELAQKGIEIPASTFDWLMSTMSRDPDCPVVRSGYGQYTFMPRP